jgi:hypothetical protein
MGKLLQKGHPEVEKLKAGYSCKASTLPIFLANQPIPLKQLLFL